MSDDDGCGLVIFGFIIGLAFTIFCFWADHKMWISEPWLN